MPTFQISESTTYEVAADTAAEALEIYLADDTDERVTFVGVNERTVEEVV